jgi:hypothetical protein
MRTYINVLTTEAVALSTINYKNSNIALQAKYCTAYYGERGSTINYKYYHLTSYKNK